MSQKIPVWAWLMVLVLLFSDCTKQENTYIYEVNTQEIAPATARKNKLKTPEQYVAILHVNLFQYPLSANEIYDVSRVLMSIGDKFLAQEVIISNFMETTELAVPTSAEMRANLLPFIDETYERFFIRHPTEVEKEWFVKYVESNPNVTPAMIYMAFALANEYQFY